MDGNLEQPQTQARLVLTLVHVDIAAIQLSTVSTINNGNAYEALSQMLQDTDSGSIVG